jgi:class 3 adenylate cyclase
VTGVAVGSEIGGFRIERLLGRGGAGEVYLAYDLRLGRKVALKLLSTALADDPALRERFVRESQVLASLEHQNVIPLYAAGEDDGRFYMAMRYIPGGSLKNRLAAGALEPEAALGIVGQIALALDAAHAQQLVHRDVKPPNILVDEGGVAYLMDFFVSTDAAEQEPTMVWGTPAYMAPEVARGRDADWRADLYSLACVLFECLAGGPPFDEETGHATLEAQVRSPVPPISERRPELPARLDGVFATALSKEPRERFTSAAALIDAAADALGRRARRIESGIVTFLFTDIEGSTGLLRRLRGRYPDLIAEHQRLLRATFAEHGGREVDTQGESFFAVFPSATDAALAAASAHAALAANRWPDDEQVRIRIGLHTGHAVLAGERYFGLAVHRAARICSVGSGGQTVLSETARALLEDEEDDLPGLSLRDLGPHELKDFERPVRLYSLVAD